MTAVFQAEQTYTPNDIMNVQKCGFANDTHPFDVRPIVVRTWDTSMQRSDVFDDGKAEADGEHLHCITVT